MAGRGFISRPRISYILALVCLLCGVQGGQAVRGSRKVTPGADGHFVEHRGDAVVSRGEVTDQDTDGSTWRSRSDLAASALAERGSKANVAMDIGSNVEDIDVDEIPDKQLVVSMKDKLLWMLHQWMQEPGIKWGIIDMAQYHDRLDVIQIDTVAQHLLNHKHEPTIVVHGHGTAITFFLVGGTTRALGARVDTGETDDGGWGWGVMTMSQFSSKFLSVVQENKIVGYVFSVREICPAIPGSVNVGALWVIQDDKPQQLQGMIRWAMQPLYATIAHKGNDWWSNHYWEPGQTSDFVTLHPDNTDPGIYKLKDVTRRLHPQYPMVRMVWQKKKDNEPQRMNYIAIFLHEAAAWVGIPSKISARLRVDRAFFNAFNAWAERDLKGAITDRPAMIDLL